MKYNLLLIYISINVIFAQHVDSYIFGNVIDAETREPISLANIYLSNTSIGCISDEVGYFELHNLPKGKFDIIISVIGYELLKVNIAFDGSRNRNIRFELYKQPVQLPDIIVTAKNSKKRNRQLQVFKRNLLGNSQNGKKTYIENEEVIRFIESGDDSLKAKASEPLVIVNKSLGYKIYYILEEFLLTPFELRYRGYPHFTELSIISTKDSTSWLKNRKNTYKGSLRHFLATIAENYEITNGDTSKRDSIFRIQDLFKYNTKISYASSSHIEDEGFFVLYSDSTNSSIRKLINTNCFLRESTNPSEIYLFFNKYLEVNYTAEYFPFKNNITMEKKTSWIKIIGGQTIIDKEGRFFDTYAIKTYGLWSQERLGDMLPFDYSINK